MATANNPTAWDPDVYHTSHATAIEDLQKIYDHLTETITAARTYDSDNIYECPLCRVHKDGKQDLCGFHKRLMKLRQDHQAAEQRLRDYLKKPDGDFKNVWKIKLDRAQRNWLLWVLHLMIGRGATAPFPIVVTGDEADSIWRLIQHEEWTSGGLIGCLPPKGEAEIKAALRQWALHELGQELHHEEGDNMACARVSGAAQDGSAGEDELTLLRRENAALEDRLARAQASEHKLTCTNHISRIMLDALRNNKYAEVEAHLREVEAESEGRKAEVERLQTLLLDSITNGPCAPSEDSVVKHDANQQGADARVDEIEGLLNDIVKSFEILLPSIESANTGAEAARILKYQVGVIDRYAEALLRGEYPVDTDADDNE